MPKQDFNIGLGPYLGSIHGSQFGRNFMAALRNECSQFQFNISKEEFLQMDAVYPMTAFRSKFKDFSMQEMSLKIKSAGHANYGFM